MMSSNVISWWSNGIKQGAGVHFPSGNGLVPPVAPEDVARLAALVLQQVGHEGMAYDVTGPEGISIREMVAVIGRIIGEPISFIDVPAVALTPYMERAGLPTYVIKGLIETLDGIGEGRFARVSDVVERLTGRRGKTFSEWLSENAELFQTAST